VRIPRLALGAAAGLVAVLALLPATGDALNRLATARAAHARMEGEKALPPVAPPIAPPLILAADDAAAARARIMARVQALARAGGVLVEETSGIEAPARLVALRIRVSGAEKAVLALADALERDRPLVRLRSWRIEPIQGGGVRLVGEAVAVWR
jgi:hypothetical protein